jgi:hypothetical protein
MVSLNSNGTGQVVPSCFLKVFVRGAVNSCIRDASVILTADEIVDAISSLAAVVISANT